MQRPKRGQILYLIITMLSVLTVVSFILLCNSIIWVGYAYEPVENTANVVKYKYNTKIYSRGAYGDLVNIKSSIPESEKLWGMVMDIFQGKEEYRCPWGTVSVLSKYSDHRECILKMEYPYFNNEDMVTPQVSIIHNTNSLPDRKRTDPLTSAHPEMSMYNRSCVLWDGNYGIGDTSRGRAWVLETVKLEAENYIIESLASSTWDSAHAPSISILTSPLGCSTSSTRLVGKTSVSSSNSIPFFTTPHKTSCLYGDKDSVWGTLTQMCLASKMNLSPSFSRYEHAAEAISRIVTRGSTENIVSLSGMLLRYGLFPLFDIELIGSTDPYKNTTASQKDFLSESECYSQMSTYFDGFNDRILTKGCMWVQSGGVYRDTFSQWKSCTEAARLYISEGCSRYTNDSWMTGKDGSQIPLFTLPKSFFEAYSQDLFPITDNNLDMIYLQNFFLNQTTPSNLSSWSLSSSSSSSFSTCTNISEIYRELSSTISFFPKYGSYVFIKTIYTSNLYSREILRNMLVSFFIQNMQRFFSTDYSNIMVARRQDAGSESVVNHVFLQQDTENYQSNSGPWTDSGNTPPPRTAILSGVGFQNYQWGDPQQQLSADSQCVGYPPSSDAFSSTLSETGYYTSRVKFLKDSATVNCQETCQKEVEASFYGKISTPGRELARAYGSFGEEDSFFSNVLAPLLNTASDIFLNFVSDNSTPLVLSSGVQLTVESLLRHFYKFRIVYDGGLHIAELTINADEIKTNSMVSSMFKRADTPTVLRSWESFELSYKKLQNDRRLETLLKNYAEKTRDTSYSYSSSLDGEKLLHNTGSIFDSFRVDKFGNLNILSTEMVPPLVDQSLPVSLSSLKISYGLGLSLAKWILYSSVEEEARNSSLVLEKQQNSTSDSMNNDRVNMGFVNLLTEDSHYLGALCGFESWNRYMYVAEFSTNLESFQKELCNRILKFFDIIIQMDCGIRDLTIDYGSICSKVFNVSLEKEFGAFNKSVINNDFQCC